MGRRVGGVVGVVRCAGCVDGTVSLSRGSDADGGLLLGDAADVSIHSWDLARGIGADETLDAELVVLVYERMLPHVAELEASGMFGKPIEVPDDAPLQTKLLVVGRRA